MTYNEAMNTIKDYGSIMRLESLFDTVDFMDNNPELLADNQLLALSIFLRQMEIVLGEMEDYYAQY